MRAGLVLPVPNFLIATATEGAAQSASVFPAGQACWRRSVEDRIITQVVQARPRPHSTAPHRAQHSSTLGFCGGGVRGGDPMWCLYVESQKTPNRLLSVLRLHMQPQFLHQCLDCESDRASEACALSDLAKWILNTTSKSNVWIFDNQAWLLLVKVFKTVAEITRWHF